MLRTIVALILSGGLLAVGTLTGAAAAHGSASSTGTDDSAGIGIRLLDIPAATQTDPRARSYIVDSLMPGATIERRVQISNATSTAREVSVYAGAARIEDGSFIGEEGSAENELTRWIDTDESTLRLAPGESANVKVTISVPTDAAEGERYAAVWAETRSPSSAGVVTASRVGVRVYLMVAPGNGPSAAFEIESVTADRNRDGVPRVTVAIANSGGRALDVTGRLSLSDGPGGLSAGPFDLDRTVTLAPGDTGDATFTLESEIPAGPWSGEVELSSGLLTQQASVALTFPDSGASEAEVIDPNYLWLAIAVLVVVAALVAIGIYQMKRRRATEQS